MTSGEVEVDLVREGEERGDRALRWILFGAAALVAATQIFGGRLGLPTAWQAIASGHLIEQPFFASMLAAALVFQLASKPSRREAIGALVGGTCLAGGLAAVRVLLLHHAWLPWNCLLVGLGAQALGTLALRSARDPDGRARARRALGLSLLFVAFAVMAPFFLSATVLARPEVLDSIVALGDRALQLPFGSILQGCLSQDWFDGVHPLGSAAFLAYMLIPLDMALVMAGGKPRARSTALEALVLATTAGFVLYFVFPVVGPRTAYHRYFPDPGALSLDLAAIARTPRNCMPSLHFTWALLSAWNARGRPALVRWITRIFLLLTFAETLGAGLHYFCDLIVALPFALAVQSAVAWRSNRALPMARWGLAVGGLLTAAWLAAVRFADVTLAASAVGAWLAVGVTVAGVLVLEAALHRPPRASSAATGGS